ncbi:MAG: adenylate/guanylate cyclase domain-containing protein [Planctomycetia bacterium]|nr:adenylate/guanylate cyclase domain-containing protein [Planctomycetia bacterium]
MLAEMGFPAIADAQATFDRARAAGARGTSRYEAGGAPWRAAFRPYALGTKRLWIGVAIPEADFLGEVERQRHTILYVSGGALLLAVLLALALGRVYARPLGLLAAESDRITALDLAPGPAVRSHLREVHRLAESQERMRGALDSFAKYVPTPVVRELLRQGEAARLGGRVRPVTVLFTDIRGFTGVSEGMTPAELTALLADYFARAMAAIDAAGGAVDKMIGDAIMALFGAPVASDDHAARAVRAALACDRALTAYEAECLAAGKPPLVTHFGLASGDAFVGNVGSADRLNFTALGDVVNLASRLEGACKVYGVRILCADAVRRAAGDAFAWRLVDVVGVKGRATGERVHEPLGPVAEVPPARLAAARAYEAAFEAYLARRFDDALGRLAALAPDPSVARLRAACEAFRATPPPPGWDGVARLVEK